MLRGSGRRDGGGPSHASAWLRHSLRSTSPLGDPSTMGRLQHLRLTHPALDFWIDVRLREFDGRWLAVADLADTPQVGSGDTPAEALGGALASLSRGLEGVRAPWTHP